MYRITLMDYNMPSCTSGVYSCYCDDIDTFEKNWLMLERDEQRIQRFKRSKAGECVTDYYSDDPRLNIVQKDANAKVYASKEFLVKNRIVTLHNGFDWPSEYAVSQMRVCIKYIEFQGEFIEIATWNVKGIALLTESYDDGSTMYRKVQCYGNPLIKQHSFVESCKMCDDKEIFKDDTLELFVYYPLNTYDSYDELMLVKETRKEITDEELDMLMCDIIGDAG